MIWSDHEDKWIKGPRKPLLKFRERGLALLRNARYRAKKNGIIFTLEYDEIDWPVFCPVLGTRLDYGYKGKRGGPTDFSPSLDRIISAGPYTLENVNVISWLANRIRSNAEVYVLEKVLNYSRECEGEEAAWHSTGHRQT